MRARIHVTPKRSVLDPQGKAVAAAIQHLGMECVKEARVGKYIELEIAGENLEQTRQHLDAVCKDLLSNPLIEDYRLELDR